MTYEDNTGIHTQDFVISGIWECYGNQAIFYVSDAFYKDSGYSLDELGMRTTTILSIWMLPASTILMPAQRKHMPETRT